MKSSQSFWTDKDKLSYCLFLVIAIIVYPALFIWQCGDLTDSGFFALSAQNFFSNLQEGKTTSISFLSDLIGAIWYQLFPKLGIIGFKILYLIFLYASLLIIYFIFKKHFYNKFTLLIAIFIALAFATRSTPFIFSRDISSWFLILLCCLCIMQSISTKQRHWLGLAGAALALSIIGRFPNILLVVLIPLAFLLNFWWTERQSFSRSCFLTLKKMIPFFAGLLCCCLVFFAALEVTGLRNTFLNGLKAVEAEGESSYSLISLITIYLRDLIYFLPHLIAISCIAICGIIIMTVASLKKIKYLIPLFLLLVFAAAFVSYAAFNYEYGLKYLAPALCATPLIYVLLRRDPYSLFVILFSFLALSQVTGSNTGLFLKLMFGMMLLIPLSLLIISRHAEIQLMFLTLDIRPIYSYAFFLLMFFSVYARLGWIYHVGEGISIRASAIYPVDHPLMKGIYTTEKRSKHIRRLSRSIKENMHSKNSLFIFGHQPMFYFLSQQKPPIEKYWLTNDYVKPAEVFRSLEEHLTNSGKWPLIVDTRQKILGKENLDSLNSFLKRHHYVLMEDHPDYAIWNLPE